LSAAKAEKRLPQFLKGHGGLRLRAISHKLLFENVFPHKKRIINFKNTLILRAVLL
jgi:hypothetical protein